MDTQTRDILKHLLERMNQFDNHQHKLDRVIERLDTLQNIIERQNQKQNLLDEKLVEMTIKCQQEKAVTAEQLLGSLQEIVEPCHATDRQGRSTPLVHTTAQPLQSLGTQIGDKLKSIEDRTVETAHKCHHLTSLSHKMEDKITELAGNSVKMTTFLLEITSVKDLIKGQTNSELIWLNNQIDKKLSDISSIVRDIHQQQTEAYMDNVRSKGQVEKTAMQHGKQQGNTNETGEPKLSKGMCDKQMQLIQDLERDIGRINASVLEVPREIKTYLDTILRTNTQSIKDLENTHFEALLSELQMNGVTVIVESEAQTSKIISAAETAKEDLKKLIKAEGDSSSKSQAELRNIHTLIDSILISIQGHMTTLGEQIDSTKASILSRHETMNKQCEELSTHTAGLNAKLEKLTTDLKEYIYNTKREIFAVTEKEAQIVRDRIEGPLPSQGKYTFDFYVNNFKTLVRSGNIVESLPWHINEMQTCVTGVVIMSTNGEMEVFLVYGRHPREVGLQPRTGNTLKVKATICDIYNKKLKPIDIGEGTNTLSEAVINSNRRLGFKFGVTSCDVLLERRYGQQEGYWQGALLIRYEITVQ